MTRTRVDTYTKILDIGGKLAQTRGYNGFSYADIAAALRVTKASLHYHFPSKAELGARLIERYTQGFVTALEEIAESNEPHAEKLMRYMDLHARAMQDGRMCLCGMFAAELSTLPRPIRAGIAHFFTVCDRWLSTLLEDGRAAGAFRFKGDAAGEARLIASALQGALLVGRALGDPDYFEAIVRRLAGNVGAELAPPAQDSFQNSEVEA